MHFPRKKIKKGDIMDFKRDILQKSLIVPLKNAQMDSLAIELFVMVQILYLEYIGTK
jgi:hypothetical protein